VSVLQTRLRDLPVHRWWVNLSLFGLTCVTATAFGCAIAGAFYSHQPLTEDRIFSAYLELLRGNAAVWHGLEYSVPILLILLAHEFAHFFTCVRWQVRASLPYFGPSPLLLGTFGAFIRIRTPIYNRKALFDVGISGPLAGFALLLPFLATGIWLSHVDSAPHEQSAFVFGTPLLLRLLEHLRFPGVAPAEIALHPMAIAAWAGMLATAINLLPIGQLDGGHIVYALFGRRVHLWVSFLILGLLFLLGFMYWPWWMWAVVLFFFRRHPLVYDDLGLGRARIFIAVSAALLLIVCFSAVPVRNP
jgi:membrane-associated protease RseP (regulator of RpoE activity)